MKTDIRFQKGAIKTVRNIAREKGVSVVNHQNIDDWVDSAYLVTKDEVLIEQIEDEFHKQTGALMLVPENC